MYELEYVASTGILYSRGGVYIMAGTIDECANEFIDVVIKYTEDY